MNELSDARLIKLPRFMDPGGDGLLVVTEAGEQVPFHQIQRMFTIVARALVPNADTTPIGFVRNSCCVSAAHLTLVCDDGRDRKAFSLDQPEMALFVPPGLWLELDAKQNDSTLIVLCDRPYEVHDYIHDYAEFLSFRKVPRT
jgi:WxcM-like, C-terminal